MKLLNSKQVNFNRELKCGGTGYKILLRQANTTKSLHQKIHEQIPNQLIWCEQEKQVYYYSRDRHLFKIKFKPVKFKLKTIEKKLTLDKH